MVILKVSLHFQNKFKLNDFQFYKTIIIQMITVMLPAYCNKCLAAGKPSLIQINEIVLSQSYQRDII